jgi:predicted permease
METLRTVLPVLLMLFLGSLCRRKAIISPDEIQALKTVAVQIALPAVLLHTFAVTQYTFRDVMIPLIMFTVCIAAWVLGKELGSHLHMNSPFVPFLTTGFEAGMLGYALFTLLYGNEQVASFARIDLGQVLFVFTLYKILLSRSEGKQIAAKTLVKEMVSSPIILAIAAGVLLGATGLYQALIPSGISALVDACTDFVSAPAAALILLAIGYDLVFDDIPWKDALSVVGLRLAIMAVLGTAVFFTLRQLFPELRSEAAVILMFLLPPPFVLPVFATGESQRTYVSASLSLSTLVSILGFAILAMLGL